MNNNKKIMNLIKGGKYSLKQKSKMACLPKSKKKYPISITVKKGETMYK